MYVTVCSCGMTGIITFHGCFQLPYLLGSRTTQHPWNGLAHAAGRLELDDPWGSIPTQAVVWFCDSVWYCTVCQVMGSAWGHGPLCFLWWLGDEEFALSWWLLTQGKALGQLHITAISWHSGHHPSVQLFVPRCSRDTWIWLISGIIHGELQYKRKSFLDTVWIGTSLSWCLWLLFQEPEEINPDEELEDLCDDKEDDLGGVEEQRSVILHLLSQLKLGMDLTRVSNCSVKTPLWMQQT